MTYVDPLAGDRKPPDEVNIVCEGPCNPGLYDYDQAVRQFSTMGRPRALLDFISDRARTLAHTLHILHRKQYWHPTGWVRGFKCTVCGHIRKW